MELWHVSSETSTMIVQRLFQIVGMLLLFSVLGSQAVVKRLIKTTRDGDDPTSTVTMERRECWEETDNCLDGCYYSGDVTKECTDECNVQLKKCLPN